MNITQYYEEICKVPLLSRDQENALLDIIYGEEYSGKQKKTARDTLLAANLRFVFKKAKGYSKGDLVMFEELIAAGNEGLIVGLDKFDRSRGVRFLSYAGWWVIQRQLKEMSKMRIVYLPIWKQQLSTRIMKAQEECEEKMTIAQLKERFPEDKEKDLIELSSTRYLTFFFEDLDIETLDVFEQVFDVTKDDISSAINSLGYPGNSVIQMAFGLYDGKDRSNSYIAERLNMSREEVKTVKVQSLRILQTQLHPDPLPRPDVFNG